MIDRGGENMKEKLSGNEKWTKIESTIFKFEKKGDEIEGQYISKEQSANFNNEVYKIKDASGETFSVFGTVVLQSLMSSVKIGTNVRIVFTDVKKNEKKGQNDIKMFEVYTRD